MRADCVLVLKLDAEASGFCQYRHYMCAPYLENVVFIIGTNELIYEVQTSPNHAFLYSSLPFFAPVCETICLEPDAAAKRYAVYAVG